MVKKPHGKQNLPGGAFLRRRGSRRFDVGKVSTWHARHTVRLDRQTGTGSETGCDRVSRPMLTIRFHSAVNPSGPPASLAAFRHCAFSNRRKAKSIGSFTPLMHIIALYDTSIPGPLQSSPASSQLE